MKGIPKGRYSRELRQEAVKLVVEDKISCREAAQRLSLAPSTLAYWVKAYKEGKLGKIGKTQKPLTEVEMELARMKKELVEVKMERDILKKQPRTLPGSRCTVRGHETDATPLPYTNPESYSEGISQRFLCLDQPTALSVGERRNEVGGSN